MKKIIKIVLFICWTYFSLIGIWVINFCGFFCSIRNRRMPSPGEFLLAIVQVLIMIGGIYLINNFINKEWYRKWWSIFIYAFLIIFSVGIIFIGQSILCGCTLDYK